MHRVLHVGPRAMDGFLDVCPIDRPCADLRLDGLPFRASCVHVIDLHCHLLPAIDDGPASMEEAVGLAEELLRAGVERVVATPHVSADYQNTAAEIRTAWLALCTELGRRRVALQVLTGAELDVLHVREFDRDELERLQLGGGGTLLAECPFTPVLPYFEETLAQLHGLGHRLLLAHPERSPAFQNEPELLRRLVAEGALVQVTGASLSGKFGTTAKRYAMWALDEGLVHVVATDAHDAVRRPPVLREAVQRAGYGGAADWLTQDVPDAILRGAPLPPRPSMSARSAWRRLRKSLRPDGVGV
jgi:protein-tyrosine phosphatase